MYWPEITGRMYQAPAPSDSKTYFCAIVPFASYRPARVPSVVEPAGISQTSPPFVPSWMLKLPSVAFGVAADSLKRCDAEFDNV